jgi:hypothetical protein
MTGFNAVIVTSWARWSPSWAVSQTLFRNKPFWPRKDYFHDAIPLRGHNIGSNSLLWLLVTCFILASWSNTGLYLQEPHPYYIKSDRVATEWRHRPQHEELEPSWNSSTTVDKDWTYVCASIADNLDMQGFLVRLSRKSAESFGILY